MEPARRSFLLDAARLAAAASAYGVVHAAPANAAGYPFGLGVASGAPLPDSVVLWTRILPDPLNAGTSPRLAVPLRWEVAHDEGFRKIAARGSVVATPELAHSVRVNVTGLQPARWYWYRFMFGDAVSPVGRTRTAPAASSMPAMLKLAVASCQHWEFGSYAAHRYIAQATPDLVAFLGDYIYDTRELMSMDMQLRMSYSMDINMQISPSPWRILNSSSTPHSVKSSRAVTSSGCMTD